jgi:endonuclease-3 related protein
MKKRLLRLYSALRARYGPQGWWAGAARAIGNLHAARRLEARRLAGLSPAALGQLIRPAGTWRLKARSLLALTRFLLERAGGRPERLRGVPLAPLRRDLLAVPGIGPETADTILLYAAGRPVFVADAYTRRVLSRHRLVPRQGDYETLRHFLEGHLPGDPALFNELHALLVAVAKAHCRARPSCEGCPLAFDLRGRRPRV